MPRQVSLQVTRNIGIMTHIDADKTTTTERILYYTRVNHKIGGTHDDSMTVDWVTQEQEKGIIVTSAATTYFWKSHRIDVIDAPGHVDFTVKVERSLRVLGGSITAFCAKDGVGPQSETVWYQVGEYKVPRMACVDKMSIVGADFYRMVQMVKDRLKCNAVPIQLPIGSEDTFRGIIGLVNMKACAYYDDLGKDVRKEEIPEDMRELAEKYHTETVEHVTEQNDVLFERHLNGGALIKAKISDCIRKATIANHMVPVTCGTSYKNKGVQKLLDMIVAYMLALTNIEAIKGVNPDTKESEVRHSSDEEPFSVLAFKIVADPFVGKLYSLHVYSGMLTTSSTVYNSTKDSNERIGRILQMHAGHHQDIETVYAGDITAAIDPKDTITDDTLCDEEHPIILESVEFPGPVIRVTIEPKAKTGQEKMGITLAKLAEEDSTFEAYTDEETGQTIIAGVDELHLEIIVDRLLREFKVEVNVGKPQVPYKETICGNAKAGTKYVRQSGGKGRYDHTRIHIEPNPGKGYEFVNVIVGGAIPKEYIPAVDQGIQGTIQTGIPMGYSVVDIRVTLYDGSYHEVDSSEMAFEVAGFMAFKGAIRKTDPILMEPIMKIVATIPDGYMGNVIDDLSSHHGVVLGMDAISGVQQINAEVPLSETFGYATDMRSKTRGRGQYVMGPVRYSEVPKSVSEDIISDRSKKND